MEVISQEAYNKAFQILNLVKADTGASNTEAEALKKAEDEKAAAEKAKLQGEYQETLKKAEELKAKIEGKEVAPATAPAKESAAVDLVKSEGFASFEKGLNEKFEAIGTIIAKKDQENAELRKSLDDQTKLAQSQNEFLARLGERLGLIEKQPLDRKSLSGATYVERFEKGEGADAGKNGQILSLKNLGERKIIADTLFKALEADGFHSNGHPKNQLLEKAVRSVELGFLGEDDHQARVIAERLRKDYNITVVK